MTLRDLTPRQLYNLRRKCEKQRKQWLKHWTRKHTPNDMLDWQKAFSFGLKAGLEIVKS